MFAMEEVQVEGRDNSRCSTQQSFDSDDQWNGFGLDGGLAVMESPMMYISGGGAKSPEYKTTSKETVKMKSFLPKVILQDNIGLQLDLQKKYRFLKKEEKRSVGFWSHSQKIFIARQCLKETQQGMTLFQCLRKPVVSANNILDKKQPFPVNHFNAFGTSLERLPKIIPTGCLSSPTDNPQAGDKKKHIKLPPLQDPRFIKLQSTLINPESNKLDEFNIGDFSDTETEEPERITRNQHL